MADGIKPVFDPSKVKDIKTEDCMGHDYWNRGYWDVDSNGKSVWMDAGSGYTPWVETPPERR